MTKKISLLILLVCCSIWVRSQVSITALLTPYNQDFNTLATSGTSTAVPTGWVFSETGANANTTYTASTGSLTTGDTYSFGATAAADRAFGGILSGSLTPTIGARFTNNTGATITSVTINYTGEQWRLGTTARVDRIDFQYSSSATSLLTGTWTDANSLDFSSPNTVVAAGALDGNAAANRTVIPAYTITGLTIIPGADLWIRWTDFNASGADDGLAVDDFTASFDGSYIPVCTEPTNQPTNLVLTPTPTTISGTFTAAVPAVNEYLIVRSTSSTLSVGPLDGTYYAAGTSLGGGTVVTSTTSTSFLDVGLTPLTTYYYFIFADNNDNCIIAPNYLQLNPLQSNTATPAYPACAAPALPPTNLLLTPGNTIISGTFTAAAGANRYLSVISTSAALGATPINGTTYTAGQVFGSGTIINYSSSTSFYKSGLTVSTTYYIFVFSASAECTGEPFYNAVSLNGITTTTNDPSGIPPGYYNAAAGLTCQPLKTALKTIISSGTQVFTYSPGLWNAFTYTDVHSNDANTATIIWDMYSDNPTGAEPYTFTPGANQCGNYNGEGDCYNKEHSFPQSWFVNGTYPMYSDLHHIFPTDGKVNGIRSDYPYGEVTTPTTTTQNGSKLGNCSYPGYTNTVFEPINAYKGDLARAQLYMATRYEDQVNGWYANSNANAILLSPTDEPDAVKRKLQVFDSWFIKLLYKWHTQDPVSQKEINRNNAIYYQPVTDGATTVTQGNRNPFVDHPEYVALIWQCSGLLPVTITDFTASKLNESVVLKWYATYETNFKFYEIQRSNDGTSFYSIGMLPGQNLANYSFTDNKLPASKLIYYRLKLIDIDGKVDYSKTIAIRLNDHFQEALVYPNPTAGKITVRLEQGLSQNSQLQITDITGRKVWQQTVTGGQKIIDIDPGKLPVGRYFVSINNSAELINQSFMMIR